MQNFVASGKSLTYLNSGALIPSGSPVVIGSRIAIAEGDIPATTGVGVIKTEGVYTLAKKSGDTFSQGDAIFWDNTNKYLTVTGAGNTPAGYAASAAASADVLADVDIQPFADKVMSLQAASTASTVGGIVADFNTLLTSLQAAGLMKNA